MAKQPPSKTERDANLDKLKLAVKEWGRIKKQRLENEVSFMRSILSGRGASNTGTANLEKVSKLVEAEISDFIIFGGDDKRL